MPRSLFAGLLVAAGASVAVAQQAPSTAQVWEVAFTPDTTGAAVPGELATQVGITMFARVSILPGTHNTANFGISRVGGAAFRMTFVDDHAAALGGNQGSIGRGQTRAIDGRETLVDISGSPLAGMFAPLRGSFQPQVAPLFLGSNTELNNGQITNPATGNPFVSNVIGSRAINYGSEGTGPYGTSALVPIYRVVFFPAPGPPRSIRMDATSIGARYLFAVNGSNGSPSTAITLPNQSITFRVGVECPQVTSHPGFVHACVGLPASLSVAASGHNSFTYQWRRDGIALADTPLEPAPEPGLLQVSGARAQTLTIRQGGYDYLSGSFDCVVTNACGTITSQPGGFIVYDEAPVIVSQPTDVAACVGGSARLSVFTAADHPSTFQWRRYTVPLTNSPVADPSAAATRTITGATSDALTITRIAIADAGKFDCVITNPCGSITTRVVTVEVSERAQVCCRVDFNGDADVNADDLGDFLNCYFQHTSTGPACIDADVNNDGDVNADDIADFVAAAFGAVC